MSQMDPDEDYPNEIVLSNYYRLDMSSTNMSNMRALPDEVTVCKRWFSMAREAFSRRLVLSSNQLMPLANRGHYFVHQARCARILGSIRTLHVQVPHYVHPKIDRTIDFSFDLFRRSAMPPVSAVTAELSKRLTGRVYWLSNLKSNLSELAKLLSANRSTSLQHFDTLHVTHVEPIVPEAQMNTPLPWLNVYGKNLREICFSTDRLRSLTLDIASQAPTPLLTTTSLVTARHFCPTLRAILPTLHMLRLRVPHLCPEALDCILDENNRVVAGDQSPIDLRTLIINLSEFSDSYLPPEHYTTLPCSTTYKRLREQMPAAVRAVRERMLTPRAVWVFWRVRPGLFDEEIGDGRWWVYDGVSDRKAVVEGDTEGEGRWLGGDGIDG